MELEIKTRTCSKKQHHAVAKLCVPWTDGFDRYHHFTCENIILLKDNEIFNFSFYFGYFSDAETDIMQVNVPISKPSGYNASLNPVTVKLNLDPNCRYEIT